MAVSSTLIIMVFSSSLSVPAVAWMCVGAIAVTSILRIAQVILASVALARQRLRQQHGSRQRLTVDATNFRLALVDRDFNEADYDALLQLDENHEHVFKGALQAQINQLPTYRVPDPNASPVPGASEPGTAARASPVLPAALVASASPAPSSLGVPTTARAKMNCPVCLEGLLANEVVRILPCLHQFHLSCIDPWLLQNATCPVCKLDVF